MAWIRSYAAERGGGLGVLYQAANFLCPGWRNTVFYKLDGEMTCYKKGGNRARFLRANIHRAVKRGLHQFRYIFWLKTAWLRRLDMKPNPTQSRVILT